MKLIFIYLLGLGILFGAILLNAFSSSIGLLNWYDFLKNTKKANALSYFWLFVLYPLGLGIVAYFFIKVLNI